MSKTMYKKSELLGAVQEGDWLKIKTLLDAGADPNETDLYDNSATTLAAIGGNVEIVRLLIDRDATNWETPYREQRPAAI